MLFRNIFLLVFLLCGSIHGYKQQSQQKLQVEFIEYTYVLLDAEISDIWKKVFDKILKASIKDDKLQIYLINNNKIKTLNGRLNKFFAKNNEIVKISSQCFLGGICGGEVSQNQKSYESDPLGNVGNIESLTSTSNIGYVTPGTTVQFTKADNLRNNLFIKANYNYFGFAPDNFKENFSKDLIEISFVKNFLIKDGYSYVVITSVRKNGYTFGKAILLTLKLRSN